MTTPPPGLHEDERALWDHPDVGIAAGLRPLLETISHERCHKDAYLAMGQELSDKLDAAIARAEYLEGSTRLASASVDEIARERDQLRAVAEKMAEALRNIRPLEAAITRAEKAEAEVSRCRALAGCRIGQDLADGIRAGSAAMFERNELRAVAARMAEALRECARYGDGPTPSRDIAVALGEYERVVREP